MPQLHDAFVGLLTFDQWLVVYLVAMTALMVVAVRSFTPDTENNPGDVNVMVYLATSAIFAPIALFWVIVGLGHVLSFGLSLWPR